ncbi:RES family NAD+ phosphorylase [Lysobacter sp. A6]|uniref:RES family NAD+ phosphorylase n=1 Tax=Noviluteimonas lactosilytica TaxID=2888523 RepID=A0ABS8JHU4_9GAMM|nr:RES family NAD+ phosphorylase [Lysobacter lactosilyticus]MCC8363179.1 RES family NAD+ phosphorylase [Lysobacter lactosilyticus]
MKLVDGADEQDLLERLLETSKPPRADGTAALHYLLATPFRYSPARGGSRFRAAHDPGVFYGAESVRTACMELGYWRWRFLMDAPALRSLAPLPFTAFAARIATTCVDLREPPFDVDAGAWRHSDDYLQSQVIARVAREAGVGALVYASVRDPNPAWCVALLAPSGFASPRPEPGEQTWWLQVSRENALWKRDDVRFTWTAPA